MSPLALTGLIFGSMLLFMAVRFPIAVSMFLAGAMGYVYQAGWPPFANFVNAQAFARFASYDLSVIPLFILMGNFATHGGISRSLLAFAASVDAAQARIEAERARLQQSKQARKREQILSFAPTEAESERLRTARRKRSGNELMITEDDAFSRRLLEKILPKNDRVTSVGEPEIALERYALVVPDVLFLDINLPDVSGHELLEKILAIDPSAYIIMISGNSDRENVIRAMSLGARGFIAKPSRASEW